MARSAGIAVAASAPVLMPSCCIMVGISRPSASSCCSSPKMTDGAFVDAVGAFTTTTRPFSKRANKAFADANLLRCGKQF